VVLIMNQHGFIAEAAFSLEEVLAMAQKHCPDIMLLDVFFKGKSALDAALTINGEWRSNGSSAVPT
jgi:DNA-binding response OmpR family regulator